MWRVWFERDWWKYLLAKRAYNAPSWPVVLWCRVRNHPYGPIYYRSGGDEPDWHCANCGDYCAVYADTVYPFKRTT